MPHRKPRSALRATVGLPHDDTSHSRHGRDLGPTARGDEGRSRRPIARDWRDGKFDFDDYLIESLQTGTVEVVDPDEDDHDEDWVGRGKYLYAGQEVRYDEPRSEVEAEAAGLDPEQWIGGEFVFDGWLVDSLLVGTIERLDDERDDQDGVVESDDA